MIKKLNDRAQVLLTTLIDHYIRDGQPVGSKVLASAPSLTVSPATIRGVMAELESKGYLHSPHTSAGRVPTDLGYRLYVDALLRTEHFTSDRLPQLAAELKAELRPEKSRHELVETANQILAEMTQLVGVVRAPSRNSSALRQVEFLPLSGHRILVILVVDKQEVQNKILQLDRDYEVSELQQAANYINQTYANSQLDTIRDDLLQRMQSDKNELDQIMQTALDVTSRSLAVEDEPRALQVSGEANLLNMAADSGLEKTRDLFEAFNRKRDILYLMDRCLGAEGLQVFIGSESGDELLKKYTMVGSSYEAQGEVVGALAVIGPTRLNYEKVIPAVDITARILSETLSRQG